MNNNEKTVIEWLNEAKEQGYEWADAAIECCANYTPYKGDKKVEKLSRALSTSFLWHHTPESPQFWIDIFDDLQEKGL